MSDELYTGPASNPAVQTNVDGEDLVISEPVLTPTEETPVVSVPEAQEENETEEEKDSEEETE